MSLGGDNGTLNSGCSACREVPCSAFTWGRTRRECTLVVIEASWSPFVGPEVELLMYSHRRYSEAPHVRHLVGYTKVGVSSRATWCSSLLADSLGGVATSPNSGLVLRGILFICSCLIINSFEFVLVFFLMG